MTQEQKDIIKRRVRALETATTAREWIEAVNMAKYGEDYYSNLLGHK